MDITKELERELWEWCGIKQVKIEYKNVRFDSSVDNFKQIEWIYPDGIRRISPPTITLENLFKWAVPKLEPIDIHFKRHTSYPEHIAEVNCWFYYKGKMYEGWSKDDPSQALALAILQGKERGVDEN